MKLNITLGDGKVLVYEGTHDELVKIGEAYLDRFGSGTTSGSPVGAPLAQPTMAVKSDTGIRYWTEQSVRDLWSLLYGDQARIVKFLVDAGGAAEYSALKKQTGLGAQRLAGVLSSITRNAKKATGFRGAHLVRWRVSPKGYEYYIDPNAFPLLSKLVH